MADSKKHVRICRLCGKEHKYCNCSEYKHLEPWHVAFCSESCKDVDGILSDWGAGLIDSETASHMLRGKDISRLEFWNSSFRAAYNQIMKDVASKVDKQEEAPKADEAPAPQEETPASHEPLSVSEELK